MDIYRYLIILFFVYCIFSLTSCSEKIIGCTFEPDSTNELSFVASPTFSIIPGTYAKAQTVTIACSTPGANIHYTTDGTAPSTNSTLFSTPISLGINSTNTLRAFATKPGHSQSPQVESTYIIQGWRQLISLGSPEIPNGRNGPSAIYLANGSMVIFGGAGAPSSILQNDLWKYSIQTQTWSQLPNVNPPSARHVHTAIYDNNGNMIIFGGWGGTYKNDVWRYSFETYTWSQLTSTGPPTARGGHSAIFDGKENMIIFGGGVATGVPINDVWKYSIRTQTWTQLASAMGPNARDGHSAIYDQKGNMFIFGGQNRNDVWKYSLDSQTWTLLPTANAPVARWGHGSIYDGKGNMIVFGGGPNDIWKFIIGDQTWMPLALPAIGTRSGAPGLSAVYNSGKIIIYGATFHSDIWEYVLPP